MNPIDSDANQTRLIRNPSDEENKAALDRFFSRHKKIREERKACEAAARRSLTLLVTACRAKTGQGYKIRALLYSLWNGKRTSLLEVVSLDWELQKALCEVMLAFGTADFFYKAIKTEFVEAGLFNWFIEEGDNAR